MEVFTMTSPLLLIAIGVLGLAPGTFTALNDTCENAAAEPNPRNRATWAQSTDFFISKSSPVKRQITDRRLGWTPYYPLSCKSPTVSTAWNCRRPRGIRPEAANSWRRHTISIFADSFWLVLTSRPVMGTNLPTGKPQPR